MTTHPAGSEEGTLVSMLAKVDTQMRFVREKEAGFVEAMEQAPTLGLNAAHTDAHTASVDAALQGLAMMEDAQSFLAQVCIASLPMMVCCMIFMLLELSTLITTGLNSTKSIEGTLFRLSTNTWM